jgi:excinuclease ABC subunit B
LVIVATVSCIYGIGDRDEYHNMILTMRVGDRSTSAPSSSA